MAFSIPVRCRLRPVLLSAWLLQITACQPDPRPLLTDDTAYYPLQWRQYRTYDVSETIYRPGLPATHRTYRQRVTVQRSYLDFAGDTVYVLSYAHPASAASDWQIDSVGSVRRSGNQLLLTTGTHTVVSLLFPAFDGQRWDINRFNTRGIDLVELQRCHQPFRTGEKAFDRTLTVMQQNDSTLVSQDKRLEVYAYGTGMVYAERQQIHFCAADPGCTTPAAVKYGIRQFIRLTDYGEE